MRYKLFVISLSAFLAVLSISNQFCESEDKVKKINEIMTKCYENDFFNGTVLIAYDGNLLCKDAFGYSNLETKEAL
jgi:hypothetical protein